jgi:hypothetical protein
MGRGCAAFVGTILVVLMQAVAARAAEAPSWLPRYDLAINLDIEGHKAQVTQHVTWQNRHQRPTKELVFNFHSAWVAPTKGIDYIFLAKMLEIVRVTPGEGIYKGCCVEVRKATLLRRKGETIERRVLPHQFMTDLSTALVVELPEEVKFGESVTVAIDFVFNLPPKQGRWGQWKGVTVLSNWLPVLAYYDDKGWQPTPFVPWHQPFFNEAGVYDVHLRLPADQKVGSSGSVRKREVDGDFQELWIGPVTTREFTIVTSNRFEEHVAMAGKVKVKCLAFPEHDFYGEKIAQISARAVDYYTKWFGPYPNEELVLAESYFGWNGNECSGLIMIDERVFGMPHLGSGYVEYLVSHETCHQWFYNVLGTDGYRETFMDEAFATYFAHRLLNLEHGKNNALFKYPEGLQWLPNVMREDYRYGHFYGTIGRNDLGPPVQDMLKYRHVGNLFSAAYDRGNKIVGMIEDRLGEAAFFDFMRGIYSKYYFKIIFVDDFQRELESYTGKSWAEFFGNWLHDKGLTDWSVESATINRLTTTKNRYGANPEISGRGPYKAVVYLKQKADYDEPTTLGFSFGEEEKYTIRVPIVPGKGVVSIDNPPSRIETLPDHRIRVEVTLPEKPTQIAVDPDQILPDKNPTNNFWQPRYRVKITPLYTFLDETDLTAAYDRWNFTAGPWMYGPSYSDPWFTRATVLGVRAGAYRTEEFTGGVYTGYRTDYKDIAVGMDAIAYNLFFPRIDTGVHAEKSLVDINDESSNLDRAVIFNRYVFTDTSSMYQAPMHYIEAFTSWQHDFLPTPRYVTPGAERFNDQTNVGIHYHSDYLSPYWNPDHGFKLDLTYAAGLPILGQPETSHQVMGQISWVHNLPDGLGYLSDTRLAYRVYGAIATPTNAQLFSLGGSALFRGFDLNERQGSSMWIGSLEWRLPVIQDVEWDAVDHVVGLRNLYVAPFCDVGNAYLSGSPLGPTAVAVGAGIRAELAWLSFLERTTFRLDVAKTVNESSPWQIWVGIQNPF